MCDEGMFISSMSAKVDPQHNFAHDDTALNALRIRCDYIDHSKPRDKDVANGGKWGDWGPWSQTVRQKFICGMQARYEDRLGEWNDDTALNGINVKLCPAQVPIQKVSGYWSPYKSGQDELTIDLNITATDKSGALLPEPLRTAYTHSFDDDVVYAIGYADSRRAQNFTFKSTDNLIRTVKSTIGMSEPISVQTNCHK